MISNKIKFVSIISITASVYLFGADTISLKEVKVSANKMEENIKDIPQSVSVIDESELEEKRIKDTDSIMRQIPNLSAESFINKTRVNFRGINHSDFTNSNPVTIYIDGIATNNNMVNYNSILNNVERVEILRGPQSTIYGKDSIGGVVNIVSKEPENEWSGSLGSEYGSYNYMMGNFNANGALVNDILFLSIGGYASKDDGWITNEYNNDKKANKKNDHKFNTTLTVKPNDRLTTRLNLAQERNRENFYTGGTAPFGSINLKDAKKANFEVPTYTIVNSFSQSLGIDYDFEKVKLSSITAHKKSKTEGIYDGDFTYAPALDSNGLTQFQNVHLNTLSQELRLASINSDKFKWVSGLYFEREKTENKRMGQQFNQGGMNIEMDAPAISNSKTMAIFGQGSYELTDSFLVTLGGRYQKIKKDIDMAAFMTPIGMTKDMPINTLKDSTSWNKFLPKAGITYKINDNFSAFLSYSQGYLAGGYNYYAFIKEKAFDAQKSYNYEIGLRGNAFDNSLKFSLTAFHMDIKDIHLYSILPGGIFITSNGGKAKSDGVEIEALYRVSNRFDISTAFGINKTKYKENIQYPRAIGKRIENTPSYTLNLGVAYTHPNGIYSRVDFRGVGEKYFDAENKFKQKSWMTADFTAGYRFKNFDIYGYVTNITNHSHVVTFLNHGGISGMNHFGDPRRFGIGVRYSF